LTGDGKLPPGIIALIVIGSVVGASIVACCCWWFFLGAAWWRRRKRKAKRPVSGEHDSASIASSRAPGSLSSTTVIVDDEGTLLQQVNPLKRPIPLHGNSSTSVPRNDAATAATAPHDALRDSGGSADALNVPGGDGTSSGGMQAGLLGRLRTTPSSRSLRRGSSLRGGLVASSAPPSEAAASGDPTAPCVDLSEISSEPASDTSGFTVAGKVPTGSSRRILRAASLRALTFPPTQQQAAPNEAPVPSATSPAIALGAPLSSSAAAAASAATTEPAVLGRVNLRKTAAGVSLRGAGQHEPPIPSTVELGALKGAAITTPAASAVGSAEVAALSSPATVTPGPAKLRATSSAAALASASPITTAARLPPILGTATGSSVRPAGVPQSSASGMSNPIARANSRLPPTAFTPSASPLAPPSSVSVARGISALSSAVPSESATTVPVASVAPRPLLAAAQHRLISPSSSSYVAANNPTTTVTRNPASRLAGPAVASGAANASAPSSLASVPAGAGTVTVAAPASSKPTGAGLKPTGSATLGGSLAVVKPTLTAVKPAPGASLSSVPSGTSSQGIAPLGGPGGLDKPHSDPGRPVVQAGPAVTGSAPVGSSSRSPAPSPAKPVRQLQAQK
jgi:hypothetical protein